jgi:DNA-binding MarR family transcriptional regulator
MIERERGRREVGATASRRSKAVGSEEAKGDHAPAPARSVDYGTLDRRLGYLLRRAQVAVFRDFFSAFEPHDLRPGQYSILTVIESNPGLKQGEVGEALGIKRANFVAMIDELERRKLVRRANSLGDRRSYALRLTARGERLMPVLHALSERRERRLIDAIGIEAYRSLAAPLKTLARLGEAEGEDG